MAKNRPQARKPKAIVPTPTLLDDVRKLILEAREETAQAINAALTLTYWHIGDRIRRDILQEKRAEYGEEIVSALGRQLETEFGGGFGEKNLRRMMQFAEAFPDEQIVAALPGDGIYGDLLAPKRSRTSKLSPHCGDNWGGRIFKTLIPIKDPLKRDFYAEMCRIERWSTRMLQERIQSMLYDRETATEFCGSRAGQEP